MTGAELLIRSFAANGIDTVYGVPGEETTALMAAIETAGLHFVLCRHEQAAAFMASVHGRLTGSPAICLATLGPGATNLVTGVADATLDFAPLIAVTGQAGRARLGRESHQVIDLERLFAPVAKLSKTILSADTIAGDVAEAIGIACDPRPGAVHLCLPEDIAAAPAGPGVTTRLAPARATPLAPPGAVDAIAVHIRRAEAPVLLAGHGILRAGACDAFAELVAATGLPVATSFMAKGVLPADHPRLIGTFGQPSPTAVDGVLDRADLFVSVGFDPIEYPPGALTGDRPVTALGDARMPRDAGWDVVDEAVGDMRSSLAALTGALTGFEAPGWAEADGTPDPDAEAAELPDPRAALRVLNGHVAEDDIVLSGVGQHKLWLAEGFHAKRPGQMIVPNGLAGMGLALPGAIAAARAYPDRHVLAVCGDGDVLMNLQEMETATRIGAGVTVLVWIDGGYGLIEKKHQAETGQRQDLSFCDIGWRDLAHAFDWTHAAAATTEDLRHALARARARKGRHLITIPVTYEK